MTAFGVAATPAVLASLVAAALAPLGITAAVALAALHLAGESKPATHIDLPPGPAVRQVLDESSVFRAAYLVHAALRIAQRITQGQSLAQAVRHERHFLFLHRRAQRQRLRAAQTVDRLAAQGHAWLTWRLGPAKHHTAACVAADGHPFPAARRPLIGWPGSTHPGCTCYPTAGHPPYRGQLTVDEATGALAALGVD